MLVNKLMDYAITKLAGRKIKDIRSGLGYTCIMLEDNTCGLAYTFRNEMGNGCSILSDAGKIIGRGGQETICWAESNNRLKAAIGLATINAAINNDPNLTCEPGNITGALNITSEDTCGMIGEFKPIMSFIEKQAKNVYVFEQNIKQESGFFSEKMIPTHLPQCDVVIITATSIINQTIDEILANCQNAREVCILGLSTPLCPLVFKDFNVTLLAGSIVLDPEKTLQIVSQGGGVMNLKPFIKQVIVRI